MTPYEIISKKRDGQTLSSEEISFFINNFTIAEIPDYQMSALLMAIYLKGMNERESRALMEAYLHSGQSIDLDHIPGIKVDKHSTGGVGDKVSIILAPIVAAAGVTVPMISGRGLGHTGGTLDKLESIPGFKVDYNIDEFRNKLEQTGVCLIGQTKELAPADKKIYALRDVTATVQSIPLISASIMSKKIAE
jgi:pyrimidine-nucleoside phosphorylase